MEQTINITNVNKEASVISFIENGLPVTKSVVAPADIKYLRQGMATIKIDNNGYVSYGRMEKRVVAPQPIYQQPQQYIPQPAPVEKEKFVSKIKVFRRLTDDELIKAYNDMAEKVWVKASNVFEEEEGLLWKMIIFYAVQPSKIEDNYL